MTGTLGDFLIWIGQAGALNAARLSDPAQWPIGPAAAAPVQRAQPGPGIEVWWRGPVQVAPRPRGGLALVLEPLLGRTRAEQRGQDCTPLAEWAAGGEMDPLLLRGRFALIGWDNERRHVSAYTDGFRTCPIYWAQTAQGLVLASDLRLIARSGLLPVQPNLSAIYQYLNFSYMPAPVAALQGVSKMPAGCRLALDNGQVKVEPYWDPTYPEDIDLDEEARVAELRKRIVGTIEDYRPGDTQGWGAFLSGGTDSSSICGILSRNHPAQVNSFSIGFAEEGYDELEYSRIASSAFGLHAHEYRVGEADTVDSIPALARVFDEPFGNLSAIPTFQCAHLAAQSGVDLLIGGDGGDEIFGGNERYRKDAIFEMYHRAPAPVHWLGEGLAKALSGVDQRLVNRVKNFIHRGTLPNPDRFYSDDSFASEHYAELLSPRFRAAVGVDDALDVQRRLYAQAQARDPLHRLMYLDLKMTIADNDVVKVVRGARLAGVDVAFPYLDRGLVDFAGRLPGKDKLRGSQKRYLFKRAADDILPAAIRNKRKQGFGLPASVWLRHGGAYRDMLQDVLLAPRTTSRGYFQDGFVQQLLDRHERGTWDHSPELHMMLMLELWHREVVDAHH